MCVDSILRNKLFEKGIVEKIIPLLNIDETRHLALRALSTITHHGGANIRIEIAKNGNVLSKLLRDLPDDEKVADLGVTVLAHCISAVVEGDEKPAHSKALKSIDMVDIIKTILETVKRPHSYPGHMIDHALELMANASLHAASAFKAYPPSIGFLVAGMRSKDWATRCTCLGGLIRLYRLKSEEDQKGLDPNRFMAALQRGVPGNISDILMNYGPLRCETYLTLSCTTEFQKAMIQMASGRAHDLYTLGLKEVELILKTEFAITDGGFQVEDPETGRFEIRDFGLPFKMWADSLPHCALAIRNKKNPQEEDLADILDIKYAIMKGRISDAISLAQKGIQRNPDQAYFYYAITLSADTVQGLRAAKQGLKCKTTTPFVTYQMMQRAVQHAGEMGMQLLQDMPEVGDKKWEEGIAFLKSALDDANAYMAGAPPDNRHMKNVGYWHILLTILLADDLSQNLYELEPCLERLKIADQYSEFIGIPPPKTNLRLAQQAAVKYYATGVREFSRVFAELDKYKLKGQEGEIKPNPEKLEDDLATWLEGMRLEDGTMEETFRCGGSSSRPEVIFDSLSLYRCSWCGNPSAALKKCSGCAKTRYCDSGCQKLHWGEHKKVCKN
ncbi:hypothetical protein BJ912DRAFT_981245 [Pholiota molesta]|nr:hypothetical protein BJ912DRAFT_981245 [Pholiota molesta]